MMRIKSSVFASVVFAIFPGLLWSISITIVYDDHFYDSFEPGEPWENVDPNYVKQFIEDRVTDDFSSYGIPVSVSQSAGPSLTVYIGKLTMPCQGHFGDATIGSYINGTTWCAVFSNQFACEDEWQGSNATVSRIGEAISGTASHELGHVLNLYHAYMFDSFDPTIPGALNSFYQPEAPENLPASATTDPNKHYHLMATSIDYITLEQRATINRYFADNSNQILLFAEADGADIYRNTTWGINNRTFTLENDINISSGKRLIIAAGGYTHNVASGHTTKFGTGATLEVRGALKVLGASSNRVTFTSVSASPSPGDWEGIYLGAAESSNSVIKYATIKYGKIGIKLNNSEPQIEYCIVEDNSLFGIQAINSYSSQWDSPDFKGNTIRDNNFGSRLEQRLISKDFQHDLI